MKFSPLCTRDDGREITFTATDDGVKYRFTVPSELLNDECGDTASEAKRKDWVTAHMPGILSALVARTGGGIVKPPYTRVVLEEID